MEMTAKEQLIELEEKRTELKAQVAEEKKNAKVNRAGLREERDEKIAKVKEITQAVLKEIFAWNKLGKNAKIEANILDKLTEMTGFEEVPEEPEEVPEEEPDAIETLNEVEEDGSDSETD